MESLPGVVCIFNASGIIRRWNSNFLGYSIAEKLGSGITATVAPESLETVQRAMRNTFETGAGEADALLIAKNGAKIPCLLTGVRTIFENETCLIGIALDNSARKQAEEHGRLQSAALESAANAVVITDARGTIQWVNRAFTLLTGYSLEEAVGQNPRILKSDKQDESFYKNLWNTVLSGYVWSGELRNRKKERGNLCRGNDHRASQVLKLVRLRTLLPSNRTLPNADGSKPHCAKVKNSSAKSLKISAKFFG